MTKKREAPNKKDVLERLDHHEKILHLLIDRLNQHDAEILLHSGSLTTCRDDIDGIIGWKNRSLWEKVKEAWPW